MPEAITLKIEFPEGRGRVQFNPKIFKRYLRKEANKVTTDARRLVSRKGVSRPGEYFGRDTGDTFRSIRARISGSGWTAVITPNKRTARQNERDFYPTILTYGVKDRIKPRKDPIVDAFEARREHIRAALAQAFSASLGIV